MSEASAAQALQDLGPLQAPPAPEALDDARAAALGLRVLKTLMREGGGPRRAMRVARAEGLLPLVRLAGGPESGSPGPSPRRPGKLQEIMGRLARENARAVSRALADEGIAHAFTKGVATAPRYGRRSLRPMSDIDVLVREGELDRVRRVVSVLGYDEVTSSEVEAVFVSPPRGGSPGPGIFTSVLDVHTRLGYVGQFEFAIEEMLARAATGSGLPVLSPEDEILALAAHAARHRMRLVGRSECDVAVITLTSRVDWEAVVVRAGAWGLSAATWAALTCARRAFGARVPAEAIERLRPSPFQEAWLKLWLDFDRASPYRLSRRRSGGLHRRAMLFLMWPALSDGLAAGAWFVARYSARMLARALARGKGDR